MFAEINVDEFVVGRFQVGFKGEHGPFICDVLKTEG